LIAAIRESTKTGRPCGHADFTEKMETFLGRRLAAAKRGRPRKGI
jgi:hypothetical protein